MRNSLLLPRFFRIPGLILTPVFGYLINKGAELSAFERSASAVSAIKTTNMVYTTNASGDVWMLGLLLSLLAIAFSKIKQEDEYTSHLRLRALMQSVYFNYILSIVIIFTTHGFSFLFLACINVVSLLLVFCVLFYGRMAIGSIRKTGVA